MELSIEQIRPLIGENGRFQKLLTVVFGTTLFATFMQPFLSFFITLTPGWRCVENSTLCHWNGTFPGDDERRYKYIGGYVSSVVIVVYLGGKFIFRWNFCFSIKTRPDFSQIFDFDRWDFWIMSVTKLPPKEQFKRPLLFLSSFGYWWC